MLTRSQVAKRLGKSIATVRRLEGDRLHPRRDEAGINRFDPAEVDRLAADLRLGRRRSTRDVDWGAARTTPELRLSTSKLVCPSASSPPADSAFEGDSPAEQDGTPDQAMKLNSLAARPELETRRPDQEWGTARDEVDFELVSTAENVVAFANQLSDRELRRLDLKTIEGLAECVVALAVSLGR